MPNSQKAAAAAFREFTDLPVTTIWFESPRRLGATLQLMYNEFGDRLAVIARELTKLHENFHRDSLKLLTNFYAKSGAQKAKSSSLSAAPTKVAINLIGKTFINASRRNANKQPS